jgi:hypothetical protein
MDRAASPSPPLTLSGEHAPRPFTCSVPPFLPSFPSTEIFDSLHVELLIVNAHNRPA